MGRLESTTPGSGVVVDDILEHYGVLGMHWGKRKQDVSVSGDPTPAEIFLKPGQGITKSRGGHFQPASEDAKKAAFYKQRAKNSTVDSLSNVELSHLIKRIGLEQQYTKIANEANHKKKSASRKFIEGLLLAEGKGALTGKQGPITAAVSGALGAKGGSNTAKTVDAVLATVGSKKYGGLHRR